MSKKKVGIILGVVAVIAIGIGAGWYLKNNMSSAGNSDEKVYVEKVSAIMGINAGTTSSYLGVVESQETLDVNRDMDKQLKEVLVSVGDNVEVGTPLFTYSTDEAVNQIAQIKLEIESVNNDITNYKGQIEELQKEKKDAPEDQQFEYTTQIQTLQTTIKQSEYDLKGKQSDIEKWQKAIDNATVTSSIAGVVKTINENGTDNYGNSTAYMTIMATGEYRVKGKIDEQNVYNLSQGQPVILRSRVDENQTWTGTISSIDTESTIQDNNNGYYYSSDSSNEGTSKYPFYVALDSTDGLILGQHLFIEPDYGQSEAKEGLWLDEGYIVTDDSGSYVWASDKKNKLEKRTVELGEYDENMCEYQIVSGLDATDYIAWPMEELKEGAPTINSDAEVE